jgi:hypothetical protein
MILQYDYMRDCSKRTQRDEIRWNAGQFFSREYLNIKPKQRSLKR